MNDDLVFENPITPRPISKSEARKARRKEKQKKAQGSAGPLTARSQNQSLYLAALRAGQSIFAVGPAGTGKTLLPARIAARRLADGVIDKIVLSRVTASKPQHKLGFLPGKLDAKMRPWLIPIFDGIKAEVGSALLDQWLQDGRVEIAAFEHMRGRTFGNVPTFVLLDEAQNADFGDLRLFLTRMGEDAQCVITGDLEQIDIPNSGLERVIGIGKRHDVGMTFIEFTEKDVVRSPLTAAWVRAFAAELRGDVENLDHLPTFLHSQSH